MKYASGIALALGICLSVGVMQGAGAQQSEVAACHVQQGNRAVHEDRSVAVGTMTVGSCTREIQAQSGTGTWGPYEIEVNGIGRMYLNGEDVGVLRSLPADEPAEGGGPGRS